MDYKYRSNKIIKTCGTTLLSLLFAISIPLSSCYAQGKNRLDVTTYNVPSGFSAAQANSSNARGYSKQYSGTKFCTLTLHASTNSLGDAATDFSRSWQLLFGDIAKEKTLPKTEQSTAKNVTIVAGAGSVDFQGVTAVAFLTTLTVNGRLIVASGIFNDKQGLKDYQTFIEGIDIDDALVNQTTNSTKAPRTSNVATAPSADLQRIFGVWTEYYFNQGIPAASRNGSASLSYKLNPDGTFGELGGAQIGSKKYPKSGRYQVNGNTLKLIYTDGHAKQYSYKFYAGMDNHEYLLLTLQGSAEEGFFRRQGK
jgi:hypothetical protein